MYTKEISSVTDYSKALIFSSKAHINMKRKGKHGISYIYHPINVANNLIEAGITDIVTLQAALLHDVIEDTKYSKDDIEARFGAEVADLVDGLTDRDDLPKAERRKEQIERAKSYDYRQANIRISDKIDNLHSIVDLEAPWKSSKIEEYAGFSLEVVQAIDSKIIHPTILAKFTQAHKKVISHIANI